MPGRGQHRGDRHRRTGRQRQGQLSRRLAERLHFAHLGTARSTAPWASPSCGQAATLQRRPGHRSRLRPAPRNHARVLADLALRADEVARRLPGRRPGGAGSAAAQRDFAAYPPGGASSAVLDGRDIGTIVCPDADAKLFVTASVEARAERRLKELRERGVPVIYAAVLEDMKERDARDSQRAVAPLKPAADAFLLDTSSMNADQALDAAISFICSKTGLSDHCA